MKNFKGLLISTAVLLCTATAGAIQTNAAFNGALCSGDVNLDSSFSISDAVTMQNYLLGSLKDGSAVDMGGAGFNLDGKIDVFDFISMRDYLANPEKLTAINWYATDVNDASTDSEYVFTSGDDFGKYFDNADFDNRYNADFFENNVLLVKSVDFAGGEYTISKIFYENSTLQIDYSSDSDKIADENSSVILQVAVPKQRYHAEEINWNGEQKTKSNITFYEFAKLLFNNKEFTWADFEGYRSIETENGLEYVFDCGLLDEVKKSVVLVGNKNAEKPENIYLIDYKSGETTDIYELQNQLIEEYPDKNSKLKRDEFFALLLCKEEYTWADFEEYSSIEIENGLEYEIDFPMSMKNDETTAMFVCLVGDKNAEKPENIYLRDSGRPGETEDIYEFRKIFIDFLECFSVPENTEKKRTNVQKLADYAFDGLANGTFDTDMMIYDEDIENIPELKEYWENSKCYHLSFIDEHTVEVNINGGGFCEAYGYFVTDGTVEYDLGENYSLAENMGWDGDCVEILERNGNVYFFYTTT